MAENYVISTGAAVINGNTTGLAGCNTKNCPMVDCLRRDERLTYRVNHGGDSYISCKVFISSK